MSDTKRRLKRLEGELRALPPTKRERRAARERLRCRYTLLLGGKHQLLCDLSNTERLKAEGVKPLRYEPIHPRGETLEEIRAFAEAHELLPVASEKSAEEAEAHLGPDDPERALEDVRIIDSAPWRTWLEQEYIPAWKAVESEDVCDLFEWANEFVENELIEMGAFLTPEELYRAMFHSSPGTGGHRQLQLSRLRAARRARVEGDDGSPE